MRKALTIFLLFLTFLFIYFLQSNFFQGFTIAGVMPNLFVILILFIGLFAGIKLSLPFGIISGLYLDIIMGKSIGTTGIMFGIVAILAVYFDKRFSKESKITMILMVVAVTGIFEIGGYILKIAQQSIYVEIDQFVIKLLIEIVYNVILTIILYPLIQKFGYNIENTFKGNRILTRYF